jgi:DNA invertase Pin-like site-specific DNA recombinase
MEKTTIRMRVKSGYGNFRKNGRKVGRKTGYKKEKDHILAEHKDIVKLLKKEYSVRKIMKLTDKSSWTVQKVKKLIKAN